MVCAAKLVPMISWQIVIHLSQIKTNVARFCQKGTEPPEVLSFRLIKKAKFSPCFSPGILKVISLCGLCGLLVLIVLHKSQPGERCQVPQ